MQVQTEDQRLDTAQDTEVAAIRLQLAIVRAELEETRKLVEYIHPGSQYPAFA